MRYYLLIKSFRQVLRRILIIVLDNLTKLIVPREGVEERVEAELA
jgi:hypothetical protein